MYEFLNPSTVQMYGSDGAGLPGTPRRTLKPSTLVLSLDLLQLSFADEDVIEDTVIAPGWVGGEVSAAACVVVAATWESAPSRPAATVAT